MEHAFTARSASRLAIRLHQLIADQALELPDDQELIDELANVRLRETSPRVYRLDHDADKHDDRAISLALAAARRTERLLLRSWLVARCDARDGTATPDAACRRAGWRVLVPGGQALAVHAPVVEHWTHASLQRLSGCRWD